MVSLRLFAITIIALESESDAKEVSGTFQVSIFEKYGFTACCDCIVKSAGVRNIYLLKDSGMTRLYWTTGNSNMLEAFIAHCNSKHKCSIRIGFPSTYRFDDFTRRSLQNIYYEQDSTVVEIVYFNLMMQFSMK